MSNPSTHKSDGLLPEKIQVLHIDDEEDFLFLTKEFVEKMSEGEIQVESLRDASKVIERIRSNEIDVIVCDYLMENLNGLDLLKTIKKEELNIPFIIFTGRGREEVVIDALNLGADYYIRKGSDARSQYTELVHQIRTVLRHKKAEEVLLKRELELKEERDLSQLYLNEANAMFVILDADENVELMNKEVTNVLGYTEKDLSGKNWFTTM
ncbi:MAG: response regulator, partial [Candidatus Heimdallarchaeota archaeon]|nr:response regulator [Candidatus Heimdallarchaeota archaeon]